MRKKYSLDGHPLRNRMLPGQKWGGKRTKRKRKNTKGFKNIVHHNRLPRS